MLYKGTKPAALYRGSYKPGKLYKGTQLIAGYADAAKAAPASWGGTYDDVMGVTATGKGKQDGTPTPSAPVPLVASEGALTASGRTGTTPTTPTTVTLPTLRAIPGSDIRDTLAYIGNGQWQVTRRVGVVQFAGTENWTIGGLKADKSDWYYQSPALADAVNTVVSDIACTHYPQALIANNQTRQGCGVVWRTVRVRWGDPPDGTDAWKEFLAAQAAAGTPMTVWYTLAAPTTETVTLGTLPSYPVHTELAVSGDYPPDVTGTVKVGI
jgi:hypothetical protein